MMQFKHYEFSILRYVHDTTSGEFINVGVVIYDKENRILLGKFRNTYSRLSSVFPDINGTYFRSLMRFLTSQFEATSNRLKNELQLEENPSLQGLLHSILPRDDSSLQWSSDNKQNDNKPEAASNTSCGLTLDIDAELESLYYRFVSKYDAPSARERRTEQDIWKDFEKTLRAFNLTESLQPKKIAVKDDEIEFRHAWKNGVWHCIEPVSFDLSEGDYFKDKAHRWLGQISSIQAAREEFKLYLLISPPTEDRLRPSFEKAVSILNKIPVPKSIYLEDQAPELASELEREMLRHQNQ